MDSWKGFDERLLPNKKGFYSNLNMEYIADVDYRHAKRVFKNFNNKSLGDYRDLYVTLYYLLIYSRILEINVLKYINWILLASYLQQD